MRKRVYIAGPITKGDLAGNINRATTAFNELMALGFAPMCPHWSCFAGGVTPTKRLDPELRDISVIAVAKVQPTAATHAEWLDVDFAWVAVSDAVLRLPGESAGADAEVAFAAEHGVPVFTSEADLLAHFRFMAKVRDAALAERV